MAKKKKKNPFTVFASAQDGLNVCRENQAHTVWWVKRIKPTELEAWKLDGLNVWQQGPASFKIQLSKVIAEFRL